MDLSGEGAGETIDKFGDWEEGEGVSKNKPVSLLRNLYDEEGVAETMDQATLTLKAQEGKNISTKPSQLYSFDTLDNFEDQKDNGRDVFNSYMNLKCLMDNFWTAVEEFQLGVIRKCARETIRSLIQQKFMRRIKYRIKKGKSVLMTINKAKLEIQTMIDKLGSSFGECRRKRKLFQKQTKQNSRRQQDVRLTPQGLEEKREAKQKREKQRKGIQTMNLPVVDDYTPHDQFIHKITLGMFLGAQLKAGRLVFNRSRMNMSRTCPAISLVKKTCEILVNLKELDTGYLYHD